MARTKYAEEPQWADITPIPQDDGGPEALAVIAYTDEYREATSYLRAVMAQDEHSERVMALTAHIISLNPAHYTVWLYRAKTLLALHSGSQAAAGAAASSAQQAQLTPELEAALRAEIQWLNGVSLRFIKNYQIWHHRQMLQTLLRDASGEADFLSDMLDKDAKNYHVWSYRQWMVGYFGLWDDVAEWEEVERRIRWDVRNNSAWNHRWFLVFGRGSGSASNTSSSIIGNRGDSLLSEAKWEREVEYTQEKVRLAPQNESPWSYLKGLLRQRRRPVSTIQAFAEEFASVDDPDVVRSSHALDVLADVYLEQSDARRAERALDLLAVRFDPIRAKYWRYRKNLMIPRGGDSAAAGDAAPTPLAAVV